MKKEVIALIVLVALVLVLLGIGSYNSGEGSNAKVSDFSGNVVSDFSGNKIIVHEESSLEFEGYKVGGSHVGTFEDMEAYVYLDKEKITGIEGVAQVSSVKTDSSGLDKHLQNEDFFDSEKYPEIKFTSTNVDYDNSEISGVLEFHGYSKEITFPVEMKENGISGEFYLDTKPFNFKFVGINPDVRIKFDFIY